MITRQLVLPFSSIGAESEKAYYDRLIGLLTEDLDFNDEASGYASHDFHSFPAKFPPQLPHKFIENLTNLGDSILDPMMGSGTTILEAFLSGRYGIGFDIDPLALLITEVKCTPLDTEQVSQIGKVILEQATLAVRERRCTPKVVLLRSVVNVILRPERCLNFNNQNATA